MEANDEPQFSTSGRHHRPVSRASSSQSRITPQSSNGSATNLQNRANSGLRGRERIHERGQNDRRESPGAILLQERLKEKKAAMLNEHRRSTDVDVLGEEKSSHGTPRHVSTSRFGKDRDVTPSSNGDRLMGKKGMGVKEMEEVNTLNFSYHSHANFTWRPSPPSTNRISTSSSSFSIGDNDRLLSKNVSKLQKLNSLGRLRCRQ